LKRIGGLLLVLWIVLAITPVASSLHHVMYDDVNLCVLSDTDEDW